jgi:hypothetical protein
MERVMGANVDAEGELQRDTQRGDSPAVADGAAFQAWRLKALASDEFRALGTAADQPSVDQLKYLARLAVLAPTSHNTVPQRFQAIESGWRMWIDRAFVLPDSDPTGRQATVSLGCSLENLVLGARAMGWDAVVTVLTTSPENLRPLRAGEARYVPVMDAVVRPGGTETDPGWLAAMLKRASVRAEYDSQVKLPTHLIAALESTVSEYDGLRLHLLQDSASLLFLGKFQEAADTTVCNREAFARELGTWLLPNDSSASVGMRGREFGLSDDVARRMHLGLRRELPLQPDEVAGFARSSNIGMRSASAVAILTTTDDSVNQRLAAGRAFEKMALVLLRHDFHTAMHAGITEVEVPNLALRGRLRTTARPTVVFRIGRPLRPEDALRPHSSRPQLEDLLIPEKLVR